ncbi:MAG TPA: hypothetical protein VFQ78_14770, partial [Candidatus Udaeobacter sp.]|nr:hypothetical protein [Candidatus Udaeobacter sp.]
HLSTPGVHETIDQTSNTSANLGDAAPYEAGVEIYLRVSFRQWICYALSMTEYIQSYRWPSELQLSRSAI